jgi:hypothetical protein
VSVLSSSAYFLLSKTVASSLSVYKCCIFPFLFIRAFLLVT